MSCCGLKGGDTKVGMAQHKTAWYCSQKWSCVVADLVLVWFLSSVRTENQAESFQKASYWKSLVKDDVYRDGPWMKNTCWIMKCAVSLAVGSLERENKIFTFNPSPYPPSLFCLKLPVLPTSNKSSISLCPALSLPVFSSSMWFFCWADWSVCFSHKFIDCSPSHLQLNDWSGLVLLLSGHRYCHCNYQTHLPDIMALIIECSLCIHFSVYAAISFWSFRISIRQLIHSPLIHLSAAICTRILHKHYKSI